MEGDALLRRSRTTLLGRGRDGESRFFESVSSGTQETRQVARGGARRRAFRPHQPSGGLESRSSPKCIPNPRCLPQIFDLEKASRASAGQAARFQRAACLADMRGGFGSLAPARLPYAGRRLRRREACALWALVRSAKRPAGVSKYKGCARPARRTPIGRRNPGGKDRRQPSFFDAR